MNVLQWMGSLGMLALLAVPAAAETIRVGSEADFPPYADVDRAGRATGYSVELFDAVAKAAGLTPQYQVSNWNEAWNALLEGRLQALPLVARLPAREGLLEYTATHTFGYDAVFTRSDQRPDASIEPLRGRCVLAMRDDAAHHALSAKGFKDELQLVSTLPEALGKLAAGHCEHLIAPIVQGTLLVEKLALATKISIGPALQEYRREFAFATRLGDKALRDRLDAGLLAIKASGEYQRIHDKWLGIYLKPDGPDLQVLYGILGLFLGLTAILTYIVWQLKSLQRQDHERITELTELEKTQHALMASEERLRLALIATRDVIWDWDPRTDKQTWSASGAEVLGWEEICQKPQTAAWWIERVHPDDRDRVAAGFHACLDDPDRSYWEAHYRFRHQDGRYLYIADRGYVVREEGGKATRMVGAMREITHLMTAQQALKESEERFRSIFSNNMVPMAVWQKSGGISEANDALLAMLGYSRAELEAGQINWDAMTPPEFRERDLQAIREVEAQGSCAPYEKVYRHKDGHPIPILIGGGRLGEANGHGVMYAIDLSQRKQAQDALVESNRELEVYKDQLEHLVEERTAELRESEARFRGMAEAAPALIWMSGEDGLRSYFNAGWLNFTGRSLAQELGNGWTEGVHPDDRARCLTIESGPSEHHRPFSMEYRLRQHTGAYRWILGTGVPRFAGNGRFIGYIGAGIDIDEIKQAEAEREAARQAALELAEVKSEFLANMSHEIRTPLNGVLGMAQIGLRESRGRGKASQQFGQILESGKLLLGIINDILDFSKIEAGKLKIESIAFSPAQTIHQALAIVSDRARAKGVGLSSEMRPGLPRACRGDPTRLQQILLNLLSNAVKFTPAGSVGLTADFADGRLILTVTDTGIGMSAAQVTRLFSPFSQADGATTRQFGGTGLGLSISKRLAELMDGDITVESTPGRGSRFQLSLPLPQASDADLDSGIEAPASSPDTSRRLAGLRILVAEDNRVNQLVLEEMLGAEGAAVTLADDGQAAVGAVRGDAQGFDIVLMDVQMPGMDGREATQRILQSVPKLPVIGQTAHALPEEHRKCLASGMVDTITKPIDEEALVALLLRHVQPRAADAAPDPSGAAAPRPAVAGDRPLTEGAAGRCATGTPGGWSMAEEALKRDYEGMRILLAEDDPANREIARVLLEDAGMAVDVAGDGVVALALAGQNDYAVILMDMKMPGLNGLDATRQIRLLPRHARTPIVAMTASDFFEDKQRCFDAGMNDFVAKPVDPQLLYATLLGWLSGRRSN